MELLPPVGWADVATKHDMLALEQRIDLRLEALESRLDARIERLEGGMQAQLRRQTVHLLTILVPSLVGTIAAAFSSTHIG
jgi:hypothetical protein